MGITTCPMCKGSKTVKRASETDRGVATDTGVSNDTKTNPCPRCNGKGYVVTDDVW